MGTTCATMMMQCLFLILVAAAQTTSAWATADQAIVQSPSSVTVSPDGAWAVYQVAAVTGTKGNFSAGGSLALMPLTATGSAAAIDSFCNQQPCSNPQFASDGSLAMVQGGVLHRAQLSDGGSWTTPTATGAGSAASPVVAYAVSPDAMSVAYTVTEMISFSTTEPRVVTDDVIVNVITGYPQPVRNVLCTASFNSTRDSEDTKDAARCFEHLKGSVGMEGWRISCWPFDSQFSWSPDSQQVALTWTSDMKANNWESVQVLTLDLTEPNPTPTAVGGSIAFQPLYSKAGDLAYTQADSQEYTWSQTWKICIRSNGITTCDEIGTADAMPTLVGWTAGGDLLYMEQQKTEVSLFLMKVVAGKPEGYAKVSGVPRDGSDCGVLGGGFRATSRVTISGEMVGFSWESLNNAPQAFVAKLIGDKMQEVQQISKLNTHAEGVTWPNVTTYAWKSDDGLPVEGLLMHAAASNSTAAAPPPLIVFTHCGPAMASLGTFVGAGSVCARFPLAIWALRGYNVLLPNYRGSTGYGRSFRRADFDGWGDGDYNDVMSGFVALARDGLADLRNSAHVGWSYGGYTSALALAKARSTHGIVLKAVVGGGCLTDLISQIGTTDISKIYESSNHGQYYWQDQTIQQNFLSRSAMYHVANATAPTLLFHGQRDPRMPISQAFQLHYALRAQQVESRFLVFPGSGHIPGDPNQICRVWDESLDWMSAHMPLV